MRSASSSTTISTLSRSSSFSLSRSISRSGVATIDVDAALQHVDLLMTRGAAVDGEHGAIAAGGDGREHLGDLQGQLAGRHEHQAERPAGSASPVSRASIGTPKASVLPEPVLARPHTSRPVRATGIALVWMANGAVKPGGGETHVDLGRHADVDERRRDVGVGIDRDGCGFDRSASWTWSGFAAPTPRCPRWAGVFRHVEHGGYRRPPPGWRSTCPVRARCG